MWCHYLIYHYILEGLNEHTGMYCNARIHLPLGLKRKFSFSNFREILCNCAKIFAVSKKYSRN
jgi:hypothetical protein